MKRKRFVQACSLLFDWEAGQALSEFARELQVLTPKDKADLVAEFAKVGISVKQSSQCRAIPSPGVTVRATGVPGRAGEAG